MNSEKKNNILLYVTVVCLILGISRTTIIPVDYVLAALTVIYIVLTKTISQKIILLFTAWICINIASSVYTGNEFRIVTTFVYGFEFLLLPYYLILYYRLKILEFLEKTFFLLTVISLPLFILNIIFESEFNSMAPILRKITNVNLVEGSSVYWTVGFYTNAIRMEYAPFALLRNCGFMWEPGYFAVIIVFSIIFNWLKTGIKFDKKFIIYSIALITTFSTSGYGAFLILAFILLLKIKSNMIKGILIPALFILFFLNIYSMNFMSGKIDRYFNRISDSKEVYVKRYDAIKMNRFQIILYDIKRTVKYPFGYGLHNREPLSGNINVVGVNGLSGLLIMWGLPIFIFFMYLIYKFLELININQITKIQILLFYLSLLMVLMSQDVQRNILLYLIILTPVFLKYNREKLIYEE